MCYGNKQILLHSSFEDDNLSFDVLKSNLLNCAQLVQCSLVYDFCDVSVSSVVKKAHTYLFPVTILKIALS